MSRFGLRSHIEYEDDENDTTTTPTTGAAAVTTTTPTAVKTTKNKHKRVYQKKKKKLLSFSSSSSSLPQEQNDSTSTSNKLEVTTTTTTTSTSTISLMCSLPLTRLSGFIEKLQLNKQAKKQATKYLLQQQQTDEANNILFDSLKTTATTTTSSTKSEKVQEQQLSTAKEKEETVEYEKEDLNHHQQPQQEIEVEHHHNSNKYNKQKQQQQQQQQNTQNFIIDKLMCLYCDKLFTTAKMQIKHIEKFHMLQQQHQQSQQQQQRTDRRSSVRNSTNNQQQQQQKDINCIYCKKTTSSTTTTTTNLIVDNLLNEINLNALFMHLIECHADKYFACKKCMLRFSNKQKLQKHMKMLHDTTTNSTTTTASTTTTLPYQSSTSSSTQQQSCDGVNDDLTTTTIPTATTTKRSLRLLQQQTSLDHSNSTDTCSSSTPLLSTEEPTILSRLGLAQNRLPTKRKSGMRLRREATTTSATTVNVLPEKLRSGRGSAMHALLPATTTTNASGGRNSSQSTNSSVATESPTREVLFRMPARNESINSFVIDDDFYKEVINNVRHNLLYFLDGKLNDTNSTTATSTTTTTTTAANINTETQQTLLVRSTLVRSPLSEDIHSKDDKELHAASLLNAITAFPTLLTAEQYGGDAAKLRRAHTKHSWKWKWDSAKKFKLINEGGKMVKKMKPLMGLRDLSKLDMWTQLSMRQKFEQQQQTVSPNELRIEKLRLNAQLNMILDKRLLPQISLEQNEQTIIKLEKEEQEQCGSEALPNQQVDSSAVYSPHNFLSVLQLRATQQVPAASQPRLILSGEWARPRSYMCMLCGAKFDKLKSLEEHKMFRHSHIYCTHYEVVGRELLANNLLQHLFLPKQALARYNAKQQGSCDTSLVTLVEDESSDSLQSSITMTTTTTPAPATQIVSPTHSLQSCSSSRQGLSPVTIPTTPTVLRTPCKIFHHNNNNNNNNNNTTNSDGSNMRVCSKCQRKCSGAMDLYRHMLDCSGDYIWSMVKKRKYRYYCGSKKRRRGELRKTPKQSQQQPQPPKTPDISIQKSPTNNQPTPRQRPSDAESIKKMLENLPAKRVCKQIFPVDNKRRSKKAITKQQLQQQKQRLQRRCKLLGKRNHHHPHHRLHCYKTQPQQTRSLRARLTKTKRVKQQQQQQQQKVNAKRVKQNQRNLRLKNLQKRKNQQQLKEVVNKKSDNEEEPPSRLLSPKQQEQQTEQNDTENAIITKTTATTTTTEANTTSTSTTVTLTTTAVSISTNTITATTTTTTMHEIFEYANSNASSTSTCTTNTLNSAASIPTVNTTGVVGNPNTTRKRSKRISDCIAMLTGKLEEKLKTEKQPIKTTTTPAKDKEQPQQQQQQQQALVVEEQSTLPKTPKRKAQTRRILKPPSLENIVDLIEPTTLTTTISTASTTATTPITTSIALTTTVVARNTTSLAAATKSCLKNMHVISSSAMPTIMQLPPPMPKPSVATTHTVVATATPLISVESSTLAAAAAATNKLQPPLHLPLPMPLPLPIPIQVLPMLPTNANNTFEEPLNLTNASKKLPAPTALSQGNTTLATCSYASNMYGLDMTTQQMYAQQDAGPLDLSLKSNRQENTKEMTATSIANIMPLALTVIPAVSHSNQPLALTINNKQVPATQQVSAANSVSAALFINECNKHFYSNLDLLKIPQVRSQLAALAATSTIMTPATLPTHNVYTHNVDNIMNTAAGHMLPGATKATMVVAPIVKKRGNNRQQMTTTTTITTTGTVTTATNNNNLNTTRIIRLYPNKKEHQLTMNEEVINHIDDAINSVINAVKASLTPERADDELEKTVTTGVSAVIPTTITTTTTAIATILPTITTTTIPVNNLTTTTITATKNKPLAPFAPIMPIKRRGRSKIIETTNTTISPVVTVDNIVTPLPLPIITTATTTTTTPTVASATTTTARKGKTRSNLCLIEDIRIEPEITTITTNNTITPFVTPTTTLTVIDEQLNEPEQTLEEIKNEESVVVPTTTKINNNEIMPEQVVENQKSEDEQKISKAATPTKTTTTTTTTATLTTTTIDKELENLSEKSTPTTQKKFRRRRKNELAAIVADQLLESFKIDKARRDSLKKLENLAYEQKSDDLFMTGMLLMSSTKRSVTMNNTQKQQQQQQQQQQQTNDLEATTTKRTSLRNRQNNNNNNSATLTTTTTTTTAKRGRRAGTASGAGTSRRRQYARRGKTLDNENISKLKSSLESFSIGIERQLTEFEAKKELQQQKTNEGSGNNINNNNTITTKPPPCSILRPSILSATPSALTTENVAKVSEQSRSAFTSRDPRLNKNIHKETDEETPKKQATDAPNDYEEEDNYLTEIAKNVNEKIMDAENEDFMFANDGLLELEDTSSQYYSRPATSMSVRSAPNFDDRSDFGSLCGDDDDEEHTNTEVMDMDLDDEMSVYTSYSQDLGRGSGRRRRRRRRSILLTRRPKKRLQRNESETEKFECTLCKKIFFSATSLSKHNMTLAHVSKVSEQEYLLSKAALLEQDVENVLSEFPSLPKPNISRRAKTPTPSTRRAKTPTPAVNRGRKAQAKTLEDVSNNKPTITTTIPTTTITTAAAQPQEQIPNKEQNSTHVGLNSDERLFFECCTILKGTQEDEEKAAQKQEDSNHFSPYEYHLNNKIMAESQKNDINANKTGSHKKLNKSQTTFRDPPEYNKNEKNRMSPNYPGISQLSAVTNTSTFRIKTKAAMKGYENVDLTLQQDQLDNHKSRNSCKLSDLADIALGNQQKMDSTSRSNRLAHRRDSLLSLIDLPKAVTESSTSSKTIMHSSKLNAAVEEHNKTNGSCGVSNKIIIPERPFKNIGLEEKEPINFQKPRTCSLSLLNNSTPELLPTGTLTTVVGVPQENSLSSASFSDRDDFDFGSLSCDDEEEKQQVKADAEEDSSNRGVKTPSNSNQLADDNNLPLGIAQLSNDSSSSRNSVKTFENKSLIMGRIFKNNTTKVPAMKLKSIGVQKDAVPVKADLNQLFDELRGDVKPKTVTATTGTNTSPMVPILAIDATSNELKNKIKTSAAPYLKIVPVEVEEKVNEPMTKTKAKVGRKPKAKKDVEKPEKRSKKKSDLSKLKNELGMSPQQIEQLIDEGQRKSKRRCATTKKFVETWSSDEYEEFLSTKDVIALIEEKEKLEQEKRKRKNSTTTNTTTAPTSPVPLETNWHTEAAKDEILLETPLRKKQRQEKERQEEAERVCFMPIESEYDFVLPAHPPTPTIPAGMTTNHKENKKESKKKKRKQQKEQMEQAYLDIEVPTYEVTKDQENKKTNSGKKRKQKHQQVETNNETLMLQPTTYLLHSMNSAFVATTAHKDEEVSTHVEKKHKSHKKKKDKDKEHKVHKEHKEHKNSKKKLAIESVENCTPLKLKKVLPQEVETPLIVSTTKKHRGRKRKMETKSNKKHSRRKREKYYWSSSSSSSSSSISASTVVSADEAEDQEAVEQKYNKKRYSHLDDAGEVAEEPEEEEDNHEYASNNALQANHVLGAEHLQKHGWIVGDSHKKLVTLLAIAKGSKKSEKKKKSSKKKNMK